MIPLYSIAFILPLVFALLLTPLVIRFAHRIGATDAPGDRKVHTSVMPRIGGLAVILSVASALLIVYLLFSDTLPLLFDGSYTTLIVLLCFISLFALGFRDDLKPLSPEIKFGVQLILSVIIYFAGFKISNITNPLNTGVLEIGIFDLPITILWIVGITNAFNLIDGLDGLASGVAVIACSSIFMITLLSGQVWASLISLIIAGALLGFLRYNFNPAKIFLGDSGSLFIGFALALLSIQSTAKISTGFAVLLPILVLALPITDTLVSMIRRLIGSFLHKKSETPTPSVLHRLHGMFTPDKFHIHHRLLSFGLSHRSTVLVLYLVSSFFALSAFIFTQIDTIQRSVTITLALGTILILCIKKLQYYEIAIFNNGLILPYYEKWVKKYSQWISFADTSFIILSFSLSYLMVYLVSPITVIQLDFFSTISLVLPLQLVTLWTTGLYRVQMNQFGIASVLHIFASIGSAVGLTAILFLLLQFLSLTETIQFLIFDFYFLLTLLIGYRIMDQALRFWFNRDKQNGRNVLIYGAGKHGILVLQDILNTKKSDLKVLGFLDDDPTLKGKLINGYPILGGHWILPKTHKSHPVDSIYLCDENICCENLKRLQDIAHQKKITLKKFKIILQEFDHSDPEPEAAHIESKYYISLLLTFVYISF